MNDQLIQLNAEYAAALDDDRLEDWPSFFTERCFYRVTTIDNYRQGMQAGLIYADSRDMLADRILSLRKANVYEFHRYRHVVGVPRILGNDAQGGGTMRVSTGFVVIRISRQGQYEVFASGQYLDEVVTESGKLLLKRRDVVCDSSRIDTLLAIPL